MQKIYIAGKISGLPKETYEAAFRGAAVEAAALGYQAVLPIDLLHDHDKSWEAHMKEDIRAMMQCDAVYAMRSWASSKGAVIEVTLAKSLGLKIVYQSKEHPERTIKDEE